MCSFRSNPWNLELIMPYENKKRLTYNISRSPQKASTFEKGYLKVKFLQRRLARKGRDSLEVGCMFFWAREAGGLEFGSQHTYWVVVNW